MELVDDSGRYFIYAHLTPTTHPTQICETLKLALKPCEPDPDFIDSEEDEESKQVTEPGDCVNDVVTKIREHLT